MGNIKLDSAKDSVQENYDCRAEGILRISAKFRNEIV